MLHGQIVSLRPMEHDDIERLWEFAQDLQVGLTTGYRRPTPRAAVERLYEERYGNLDSDGVYFAIETHEVFIGGVEIERIDWQNRSAEMVMFIGDPAYRRRGCGTDALTVAANYAFKVLGLNRLSYDVPADNKGARVVYERAGFQEEGSRSQAHYRDGTYHDLVMLGLTRDRWTDERPIEELTRIPEPEPIAGGAGGPA